MSYEGADQQRECTSDNPVRIHVATASDVKICDVTHLLTHPDPCMADIQ
jgi:hypothetical protein